MKEGKTKKNGNVNCTHCHEMVHCHNCQTSSDCVKCVDCRKCSKCRNCVGCTACTSSHDCNNSTALLNCHSCTNCEYCAGCHDCFNCEFCFDSSGFRNAKYVINNKRYSTLSDGVLQVDYRGFIDAFIKSSWVGEDYIFLRRMTPEQYETRFQFLQQKLVSELRGKEDLHGANLDISLLPNKNVKKKKKVEG